MNNFETRINAIRESLSENSAALITDELSIFYLTGFPHSEGYLLVTDKNSYLLVDFRYNEAAQNTVKSSEVIMFSNAFEVINNLISSDNVKEIFIETDKVTLDTFKNFNKNIEAEISEDNKLTKLISNLRLVKSADEVEKLRKAQLIAEEAYLQVLKIVKEGITEKELATELEYLMKKSGAEKIAFDLITVAGKKTSLPHGVPGEYKLKKGDFITFDIGAVYEGYHSDMTRTVALGEISDEQRKVYEIVLKAHLAGLEAVKPGVTGFYVDKVCRDIISENGYGEYFGHGTGHGVGLEIHEKPTANPRATSDVLEVGMTLTVEPGIYLPDKFGVRIEDTVLITENGYETFAHIPKDLIIL